MALRMSSRKTKRSLSTSRGPANLLLARAKWAMCAYRRKQKLISQKKLQSAFATHPRGDQGVQQVTFEEDRPFPRNLLKQNGAACAIVNESGNPSRLILSHEIGRGAPARHLDGPGRREAFAITLNDVHSPTILYGTSELVAPAVAAVAINRTDETRSLAAGSRVRLTIGVAAHQGQTGTLIFCRLAARLAEVIVMRLRIDSLQ